MTAATVTALAWGRPFRVEDDAADNMLRWSLVHASKCGRVLLEAGAPMTDGSTAYLIWLRVDDAEAEQYDPEGMRYWSKAYTGPLGRVDGRWYRHAYDEGGLRSAKYSATVVAHEAAL